jgi:hypothetical protein
MASSFHPETASKMCCVTSNKVIVFTHLNADGDFVILNPIVTFALADWHSIC